MKSPEVPHRNIGCCFNYRELVGSGCNQFSCIFACLGIIHPQTVLGHIKGRIFDVVDEVDGALKKPLISILAAKELKGPCYASKCIKSILGESVECFACLSVVQ
ncbi:hypothetical protein L1987_15836 [Smallanthus sonchifolius]|uniref:Uncharacterized protein n=1 Tax=Smallanthus sonchifolius TaxID=185202 RepID=A0ACB9J8T2_9ASTR|nr:hypothetical protein L1987_15836 [Smallanthus sonchifolius]